jgi:hypothetical protein
MQLMVEGVAVAEEEEEQLQEAGVVHQPLWIRWLQPLQQPHWSLAFLQKQLPP